MSLPQWIESSTQFLADQAHVQQMHERLRYQEARDSLTPEAVLHEVLHLALSIDNDRQHPLYPLISACVKRGTPQESGRIPHVAAHVGADFIPLIERAIGRLVQEVLLEVGHDR